MSSKHATDVTHFVESLDAGIFNEKLGRFLSETAAAVINAKGMSGKAVPGKVTVEFEIRQVSDSYIMDIKHKIVAKMPTGSGDIIETSTRNSPMHCGTGGKMTLYPEDQVPNGQLHLTDNDKPI